MALRTVTFSRSSQLFLFLLCPRQEQSNLEASLKSLEADLVKNKERMEQLKVQLYAKFGRSINLDADD